MNPRICIVLLLATLAAAQNPFTITKPDSTTSCQLGQPCLIEWTIDQTFVKDIFQTGTTAQAFFGTDKILVYLVWSVGGVQQSIDLTKDIMGVDVQLGKAEEGLWCNGELPTIGQTPSSPHCAPGSPCSWSPVLNGVQPGSGYTIQFNDTSTPMYVHPISQTFTITPANAPLAVISTSSHAAASPRTTSQLSTSVNASMLTLDTTNNNDGSASSNLMSNPVIIAVLSVAGAGLVALGITLLFLRNRRHRLRQQFNQYDQQYNPQPVAQLPVQQKYNNMAMVPNRPTDGGHVLPVFNEKPMISPAGGPAWGGPKDTDWFPR